MSVSQFLGAIAHVILNPLIIFGFVVALLYFFIGVFKFVSGAGEDTNRAQGKRAIVWGLVGMFIMIAVFSIINIVLGTFGINQDQSVSGNTYLQSLLH